MTEREKMLAGGWFDPRDAELTAIRDNATRLMHRLNVELCGHDDAYRAALRELCPGCEGFIRGTVPLRLRTQHLNRRRVVRQFSTACSSTWRRSASAATRS